MQMAGPSGGTSGHRRVVRRGRRRPASCGWGPRWREVSFYFSKMSSPSAETGTRRTSSAFAKY
jgi:hypothetical protein